MEILFLPPPPSRLHLKQVSKENPHRGGKAISMRPYVDFQVYPFQREALQMSGVRERILSV